MSLDDFTEEIERKQKPKYPQPHNITIHVKDINLRDYLINKAHGRLKYQAKYDKSKKSKRNYQSKRNYRK